VPCPEVGILLLNFPAVPGFLESLNSCIPRDEGDIGICSTYVLSVPIQGVFRAIDSHLLADEVLLALQDIVQNHEHALGLLRVSLSRLRVGLVKVAVPNILSKVGALYSGQFAISRHI
jgi:hypothetical protein